MHRVVQHTLTVLTVAFMQTTSTSCFNLLFQSETQQYLNVVLKSILDFYLLSWVGVASCSGKLVPARSALIGWWLPPAAPHQMRIQNELCADLFRAMAGLSSGRCCCAGSPSTSRPLARWKKNEGKHAFLIFHFQLCLYLCALFCRTDRGRKRQDERGERKRVGTGHVDVCVFWCVCQLPVMLQYSSCGLMGPLLSTSM